MQTGIYQAQDGANVLVRETDTGYSTATEGTYSTWSKGY